MRSLDLSGKQIVVEDLVKEASAALADGSLSFGEIVHLGGVLAGKVNQLAQLSGPEKKLLVVAVVDLALQELLKKVGVDAAKVEGAAQFAKEALPAVLDVAVDAARGKLDLRKPAVRAACWTGLVALLSCVGVPVAVPPVASPSTPEVPQEAPQQVAVSANTPLEPIPEETVPQVEQPAVAEEAQPSKESESTPAEVA
jgi:hypothetical protein